MRRTLIAVCVFSIAMGFLEAAVVVYLRQLYYPGGFGFPLVDIPPGIGLVEVVREGATIVMLAAIGFLAGNVFLLRFAYFSIAFGIWDIFYYVFLKCAIGWPPSLLTDDILFLLPLPWVGPVLAPLIVSICLIAAGATIVRRDAAGPPVVIAPLRWLFIVAGGALVLATFLLDTGATIHHQLPGRFNWFLFTTGILVGLSAFVSALEHK